MSLLYRFGAWPCDLGTSNAKGELNWSEAWHAFTSPLGIPTLRGVLLAIACLAGIPNPKLAFQPSLAQPRGAQQKSLELQSSYRRLNMK